MFAERLGERYLVPGEARHPHVNGRDVRLAALPAIEQAGLGLEGQRRLAALAEHEVGDATHAIAAGARLRAIVVVDAHVGVGAARARRVQSHQLIVRDAAGLRHGARLGGAHHTARPAQVDHDDLVAETVHLDEGMVGERAHCASLYGQSRRLGQGTRLRGSRQRPEPPNGRREESACISGTARGRIVL
jgi:hypothetical protein